MVEKKKSLELKKHVAAIHSNNKLSLLQRKIANALLFNAYEELLNKEEHEIHIPSLCKLIGYDSHDHKTIKKSLVNLLSTVIEWNLVDGTKIDTDGIWNASSMIADASIDGAICTYSYSNKMKKLLYRPELYGRLNMMVQAKFQSTYGLALYENCIRYQNIEQTPWFEIEKFRKLMGVEDGKYKVFRDFKNRVLMKAIEEVNSFSPITISPQFEKKGRSVIAIQFSIKSTKNVLHEQVDTHVPLSSLLKTEFGLSTKQIQDILSEYEHDYIVQKIEIVKTSPSYVKGNIKNLGSYLKSAIKENYQQIKSTKQDSVLKDQLAKQDSSKMETYHRLLDKAILKKFNRLSVKRKAIFLKEFEKHINKGVYYHSYQREGLNNILVQDQLCRYLKEQCPEWVTTIKMKKWGDME